MDVHSLMSCLSFIILTTIGAVNGQRQAGAFNAESSPINNANTTNPFTLSIANEPVGQPYQFRLINDLLGGASYDSRVRPSWNVNEKQLITIRMNLYQILDVIEPSQTIVLHVWVTQRWKDEFLGWEPSSYGGIKYLVAPFDQVWRPDTYVFNSLQMEQSAAEHLINVKIVSNTSGDRPVGEVTLMYPALYRFSCKLKVAMFPFDTQKCNFTIGSWTHNMADIDYTTDGPFVKLENYISHDEWRLISFKWIREEAKYSCCPTPWVLMHAQLKIQRKPLFYLINLVLPSAVITLVAVAGFFMPANTNGDRNEKVNLGITTLLAMAILLLMVVESMPTTSESVPLIGIFYLTVMLLVALGTLCTAYVITVQTKGEYGHRAGHSTRRMFQLLGKLLCIKARPELNAAWKAKRRPLRTGNGVAALGEDESLVLSELCSPAMYEAHLKQKQTSVPMPVISTKSQSPDDSDGLEADRCRLEWQFIACVLDRLLLIIFTTAVLLVTGGIIVVGWSSEQEGVPAEFFLPPRDNK